MVQAWFFDNDKTIDQREPHQLLDENGQQRLVSINEVQNLSGVEYFKIDLDQENWCDQLEELCKKREYKNRDEVNT